MTGKAPKSAFATFFFSDLEPINATSLSEDIRAFGVATCLLKSAIAERDRWMKLMGEAAEEVIVDSAIRKSVMEFFAQVADFMRNQPEAPL